MVLGAFVEINPIRLVAAIALLQWMPVARLVRGEFLSLRERDFVLAARAVGASGKRIIALHLLPNAVAPIAVASTVVVANAILIESTVSFLGFGIQPPTPTWGNLLTRAQADVQVAPWLAIFPGTLISLCVVSIMFIGDALRQAFDPRLAV
jgi:peptide/nickel transport system permease protein